MNEQIIAQKKFDFAFEGGGVQELRVTEIESRFSVIDKVEEVVNNALLKADRLRKSILKSAFEGKLIRRN